MRTIAVVNLKGGSGKSTLAVQLALRWSSTQKTALADIDPQGSAMLVLDRKPPRLEAVRSTGAKLLTLKTTLERQDFARLAIDTPGSIKSDVAAAIAAADLAVMVVRPSYLDIAAAAATAQLVRQLQTPALVVLNQAPPTRAGEENTVVRKGLEALALLRLPVALSIIRGRAAYGRAMERGQTVDEVEPSSAAVAELQALGMEIDNLLGS